MANQNVTRIFDILRHYHGELANKPDALAGKVKGNWVFYTGNDYVDSVNALSTAFLNRGLKYGERVATVMKNCPEWNFVDMALMQIGAVQVPVYPTISVDNFRYIFQDAEIKFLILSGKDLYNRLQPIFPEIPSLTEVFTIEAINDCHTIKDLIASGKSVIDLAALEEVKNKVQPSDLASIIYTSGTTGVPKGVMLSHGSMVSNFLTLCDILPKDIFKALSFLPLCHVYERELNYMYQNLGISIYYSESVESVAQNLKEVHPHMFCAVPRVVEKFFDKILATGRNLPGIKKLIFFWAVSIGFKYQLYGRNSLWYKLRHRIADRLVYSKWRAALGGDLKVIVSGGAALQPRLGHIFWAAGIKLMEGYGLTETSPVIAVGNFEVDGVRLGTVGPVIPGVEVKIAEDGEILSRGPNTMMGYYKSPEITAEVIDKEGWFHTGDIGYFVDNRFLKITDRKREIFKLSSGKYISPQMIENRFKESSFIENLLVVGQNKPYAAAIIVPSFDYLLNWAKFKGHQGIHSRADISSDPRVFKRIQQEINEINKTLDKHEQVKRFRLIDHDWTPESGDLSPTLKLKRKMLTEKYNDLILEMYKGVSLDTEAF